MKGIHHRDPRTKVVRDSTNVVGGQARTEQLKKTTEVGTEGVKALKGLDAATEIGPVVTPTTNRAAQVIELLKQNGLEGDVQTFLGRLRHGLGDVGAMRNGMVEAFGASGDFLWVNSLAEMMEPSRVALMKTQTEAIGAFGKDLARAESLDELKAVAAKFEDTWLPAQSRNELLLKMRNKDRGAAVAHYEATAARWPAYAQDDIGHEYYLVALNKTAEAAVKKANDANKALTRGTGGTKEQVEELTRQAAAHLGKSILEGKRHIAGHLGVDAKHPERLRLTPELVAKAPELSDERIAALGKAFKVSMDVFKLGDQHQLSSPELSSLKALIEQEAGIKPAGKGPANVDYAREALKASTRYYESAYAQDFGYYPAMPAIYNNIELGNVDRARELAKMAILSCQMAGGVESTDFWVLVSQLELALITGNDALAHQLAPKVLSMAKEGWEVDTTASWMKRLVEIRKEKGEDTTVIAFMADKLGTRANDLYADSSARDALVAKHANDPAIRDKALETLKKDQAEKGAAWCAATLAELARIAPPVPTPPAEIAEGRALAEAVRSKSISTRAITTSHSAGGRLRLVGNTRWGGQIPDIAMTRATRTLGMALLKEWGVTPKTSREDFHRILQTEVNRIFRLQTETGARPLEDLAGPEHKVLDAYDQLRFVMMMSKSLGDDATELMALAQLGTGDCRPTNYTGLYLSTLFQRDAEAHYLREAFQALPGGNDDKNPGDLKKVDENLAQARESMRWEPRVGTAKLMAPIKMKEPYVFDLDANGKPQRSEKVEFVENHTFLFWLQTDENGAATDLRARDMFYHDLYPLKDQHLDINALGDAKGIPGGTMGLTLSDGSQPDFQILFAGHSGSLVQSDPDKAAVSAGSFFAGREVATVTLAGLGAGELNEQRRKVAEEFLTLRSQILEQYGGPEHR